MKLHLCFAAILSALVPALCAGTQTPGNGSRTHACSSFHQCCTTWARQQTGRNISRI